MITIDRLLFSYSRSNFDLKSDQLCVRPNSATAIVGPSGSGKTTLLHLIAGILKPTSGDIRLGEEVLTSMTEFERRRFRLQSIGLIFQDFELIEYLNVLDNVLLPCRIGNVLELSANTRKRAQELLDQVGLQQHHRKSVTRLSQGERQRVAICRAMLANPPLLLADEPTGNLDPVTSSQILDLLLHSVREQNTTLVMVTHDHSLLSQFDSTVDFAQFLQPVVNRNSPTAGGAS
jgi:putative ABC transport system ATP-binding protein